MTLDLAQFDELVSRKIKQAEVVSLLANEFLSKLINTAPILPRPCHHPGDVKRRNRIQSKVERYLEKDPSLDLEGSVNKVTDYARGRILVYYIGDVRAMYNYLCEEVGSRGDVRLLVDAYDDRTVNCKPSGFRGCQQVLSFMIGPATWFPFEVQILTFLQHDWDQKHHAIYEEPERFPKHIKDLFSGLSEQLHTADNTFQLIRPLIEDFLRDSPANP